MEPKFQSSFIPKGPLATAGLATKVSRQSDRSVLGTLAVIVFVLAILISGGVYAYEFYLQNDLQKMGASLEKAKSSLEPEVINKISSLDHRIASTRQLLNAHTILTPLFEFLEAKTLKTVRFTSFDYSSSGSGLHLLLKGEARGYSAIALQSQIFNTSNCERDKPCLSGLVFENLSLDDKGNVSFSVKSVVDPSITSYAKKIGPDAPVVEAAPVEAVTPAPASAGATVDTTTTTSAGVFDQKFAACQSASFQTSSESYKIVGPASSGCRMTYKFLTNANPDFVGKDMTCTFDNKVSLSKAIDKVLTGVTNGSVTCDGELYITIRAQGS